MKIILRLFCLLLATGCTSVNESTTQPDFFDNSGLPEWLVDKDDIFYGGQLDGIPSIDRPKFQPASEIEFLKDNDLVFVVNYNNIIKAYPHKILDWHEVVNDSYGNKPVAITFCPLTGSGIALEAVINDSGNVKKSEFGVSGLLYNSNLIYYDRETGSYWSQMMNLSIHGQLRGITPYNIKGIEMSFRTFKAAFPEGSVLSDNTGIYSSSQYRYSIYEDYKYENVVHFPLTLDDLRLERKERVMGIIDKDSKKVYRYNSFIDSLRILDDEIDGIPIHVIGSKKDNFLVAFKKENSDGLTVHLQPIQGQLPIIAKDQNGNKYDMFGRCSTTNAPDLEMMNGVIAYWFSWASIYHGIDIFEE